MHIVSGKSVRRVFSGSRAGIFIAVLLLVSVVYAQTAILHIKFEAENGTLGTNVSNFSDLSASGGRFIQFEGTVPPPTGVQFFEDFSSTQSVNRFVYQRIHGSPTHDHTDADPYEGIDSDTRTYTYMGDHDMSCGNPNLTKRGPIGFEPSTAPMQTFQQINTSRVGNPEDQTVWHCAPGDDPGRAHLMTGLDTFAYAHLDFMPNQIFQNVRKVCFDINWSELGGRKWMQVVVVPEAYFQANGQRMSYAKPGLEGDGNVAQKAVLVRNGTFLLSAFRSEIEFATGTATGTINEVVYDGGGNFTDKAPRFTHCLTDNRNGTVTLNRPNFPTQLGGPQTNTMRGSFPTGQSRVIFQDVTYDGPKGDQANREAITWHWDNISIE